MLSFLRFRKITDFDSTINKRTEIRRSALVMRDDFYSNGIEITRMNFSILTVDRAQFIGDISKICIASGFTFRKNSAE